MRLTKIREIIILEDDFNFKSGAGKSDTKIRVYNNTERNNKEGRVELKQYLLRFIK